MNKQSLKALLQQCHALKPVILIGQKGLSDAVINEIDIALNAHELIKIKFRGHDQKDIKKYAKDCEEQLHAQAIQFVGHTCALYRQNPDKEK